MIDTARQRRAQQVEAKYAADLRRLRQAKDDDLQALDERYKLMKSTYRLSRLNIKEEYAMKRLEIKTRIERLKDQRANVRHARSCDLPLEGLPDLDTLTSQIEALLASHIKLERQEHDALADAEKHFDVRCKENQEERRAINKHYIAETEKLHEAYLQQVEQNRQDRESEEGGAEA
jgi:hypothetical protein